ncbi:hypothetical protein F511_18877 [Dorcoceras hygrometricum]|uniref:Uncharacterized protein n=1 Tax=Dorcoceras hygrometricum TaxID=472368 RepID=A0A2Z7AXD9_9LAMI|nr:hypothetical protein F511_18877 [Dorcoceras hygrometricum]
MSLFDLQDVCIVIGSPATLDLPMVVDLIGIYGLKGPYCTQTTTNWFFQALSVIPRGSWHDVAMRFTMIRWASPKFSRPPLLSQSRRRRPPPSSPPPPPLAEICSGQLFEEFPSVLIASGLLVQADEGTLLSVVDLIRRNLPPPTVKYRFPRETRRSQAPRCQQGNNQRTPYEWFVELFYCIERFPVLILNFRCAAGRRDLDPPPFPNSGIRAKARIIQYNCCLYCIRSRVLKSKTQKFFISDGPVAAARGGPSRAQQRARHHARWSHMVAGRGQQPRALRCAHGDRELVTASRNCCTICRRPLLAGWRTMAVDFAHWMRHWSAHHAPCAAHVAASVRPSAARYVVATAAAVRPPSGDDLRQIIATAEFYF